MVWEKVQVNHQIKNNIKDKNYIVIMSIKQ